MIYNLHNYINVSDWKLRSIYTYNNRKEVAFMFGNTIQLAHKALDCLWVQQEVTSANLANVDTPGYKKKKVTFEEEFERKLRAASDSNGGKSMRKAIHEMDCLVYSRDDSARVDENNVNADVEETELARTTLHYQYMLLSVSNDVKRLQSVMK
jgi:flagellar basal-body rod protein FlgB